MKKTETNQTLLTPILHWALRGVGVLTIIGIGTLGFNHFTPETPSWDTHNASEINEELEQISELETQINTIKEEKSLLQETISQLQIQIREIQTDTTVEKAILTLQEEILTIQSGQQTLEEGISTIIPLGSIIAMNGSVSQANMNILGRALCDGSSIASQVQDAILQGNTLNLAGRTLVGAGNYARDNSISFTLGHVDEYRIGNKMHQAGVTHTLTSEEIPTHSHGVRMQVQNGGSEQRIGLPIDRSNDKNVQGAIQTESAGGDQPHNNMSPFHVVHYYIKVK